MYTPLVQVYIPLDDFSSYRRAIEVSRWKCYYFTFLNQHQKMLVFAIQFVTYQNIRLGAGKIISRFSFILPSLESMIEIE